jgi:hypothetical protein
MFFPQITFSAESNKTIIDSLVSEFATRIIQVLNKKNIDKINISTKSNFEYFNDNFINNLIDGNIQIDSESPIKLKLVMKDISVEYFELKSEDFQRRISLDFVVFLEEKDGSINILNKEEFTYSDTITSNDLELIENSNYPFTKGKFPTKNKSIFDEIIEPVIIVSAAIISVVLFFTVRSN